MSRNFEPLLIVALVVVSLVVKEVAQLEAKCIVIGGVLVIVAYGVHFAISYLQGVAIKRTLPWLYTLSSHAPGSTQTVSYAESRAEPNSIIYLISPDLHNDARNPETQKTVIGNLKRNIRYKYITRDDNDESSVNISAVMATFAAFSHFDVYLCSK